MKIAPGMFAFVTMALNLIRAASSLPPFALEHLIALQPFFSSSVMNNPFQVEAIIHDDGDDDGEGADATRGTDWTDSCDEDCESPGLLRESLPDVGRAGENGKIAKT